MLPVTASHDPVLTTNILHVLGAPSIALGTSLPAATQDLNLNPAKAHSVPVAAPATPPRDGTVTEYYPSGAVTEYYPSGALKKVEHYESGQLNGLSQGFYENGQLAYEIPYEHDLCAGLARTFYPNGQLKCEQAISYDDHGRSCGYMRTYYENGVTSSSSLHQHGLVTTKQFYPSGHTMLSTTVVDGLTEGTTTWYYESGALKRTIPFSHSLIEGVACEYYEDGTLARATTYRHDLRHGPDQSYDNQGNLIFAHYYSQGRLTQSQHPA